eukprot:TRINITY_DN637_c0_g1_i14.p3 TRINITY_DN637_c0_g1~~TRINITY_DN637_c0_g1_i14.p3  ORF type:complete len:132 (+),score=63.13 TRINITY_DN637_c0_g1_i14:134-529(+)
MGRVRNKTVKRASRKVVELYYSKLTLDFHTNKRLIDEVAEVQTKKLRNKIAGYTTHLMRRLQKNPVKGISLKLQEEERERRLDFIPHKSILAENRVIVSSTAKEMVQRIPDFGGIDKVEVDDGRRARYNPK